MTTPRTPVDALMALVSEYAIVVMDDYARGFAPGVKQKQARAAVEASARALAAIPEGWQPIESLPRDETPVLIGHYYVDGVNEYSGPSRWLWVTSGGFDANTFWHDFTDDADLLSQDGSWKTATHWRPALAASPTPPTAPAQDAQGERNAQMLIDIGNAALRAGWNGVDLQAFVMGRLASPSPSAVQPLSEAQRKQITALWNKENRNYTVADIIDAVEAAHGIVTKEST